MMRPAALTLALLGACLAAPASAMGAASLGFTEISHAPADVRQSDEFLEYKVKLKNTGSVATSGTTSLFVDLPQGLILLGSSGSGWSCHTSSQSCSNASAIAPGAEFATLTLDVQAQPALVAATVTTVFDAYGGGSAEEAIVPYSFTFAPPVPFEIESLTARAEDSAGAELTKAGAHPFSVTSSFQFTTRLVEKSNVRGPVEHLRDLFFDLPAGFVGNPEAIKTECTVAMVAKTTGSSAVCPDSAAVGFVKPRLSFAEPGNFPPLYRLIAGEGYAAAFAFQPTTLSTLVIILRAKLRSDGEYHVSVSAPLPPLVPETTGVDFATLCGYGANLGDDGGVRKFLSCKQSADVSANKIPFLTNPTRCVGAPPVSQLTVDSYENRGALNFEGVPDLSDPNWKTREAVSGATTDCNQLQFRPSFEGRPTTNVADSPSGLDFKLHIPQEGLENPAELAEAHLKDTRVLLPAGMAVNPSAANGLDACTPQQIGLRSAPGVSPPRFTNLRDDCPQASKIGAVQVDTPLLHKPLLGSLYLAKQLDNPFGSLLALYIVVDDPETGTVVKLPGEVAADPDTGQLSTTFTENPQLPFEDLSLEVFEGARASLRTPATCGPKATTAEFTPWSAPESGPPKVLMDDFAMVSAPGGGTCPTSAAELPNAPAFTAGTMTPKAGAYSPFVLRVSRQDGSQELKGLNATLPPGLTGRLAGVPYCSEAAIAQATARSRPGEGGIERDNPSCSTASEVGGVEVSAGAGPSPFHTTGRAYLAGPYKGAPVSMVVITPAVAGPFDLGTVVIRNPLYINPVTTQVSVKSDPIPTILEGIPLDVRTIEVTISRDRFTLNPTSCEPMAIGATAAGLVTEAPLTQRFQVGECEELAFKPGLKLRLHGGTKRGAYQGMTATVTYPEGGGYANIARAAVTLPHSAFLAQEHIRTVCTRVQFAAKQCPPGSIYGRATAVTPLLDQPIGGPVYLRSSSNPLPDLVAALRGPDHQPIEVELAGRTDSVHGGIRNTFDLVPDAPVSKFTLELLGGKKGLIVNSRDLCKGTQRATVRLNAQNGKRRDFHPVVKNDCRKKGSRKGKRAEKGAKGYLLPRLTKAW
jgi:hypothetical protein